MLRARSLRILHPVALAFVLLLTGPSFAQAPVPHRPLTILLVGASGMIGSRILAEASSRGHHVLAAARHPQRIARGPHITPVKLDATDRKSFTALARKAM